MLAARAAPAYWRFGEARPDEGTDLDGFQAGARTTAAVGRSLRGDRHVTVSAPPPRVGLDPHPLIEAVFLALDDDGAGWCVMRGIDDLHAPTGDVDLLVTARDAPRVGAAAARAGFARLPAPRRGSHAFYVAYDTAGGRWLKLDVVTELAFGRGFALASAAAPECLRRRRRRGRVAVLDDADAFWSLLLHRLLDKGAIGAATAGELHRLAAAPGCLASPLARELDAIAGAGCAAALLDAARRGAWPELEARAPALAAAWARRRRAAFLRRRARARLGAVAGPRVRRRRGLTVALPGAGDAELQALARTLNAPIGVVWVRAGGRRAAVTRAVVERARGRLVLVGGDFGRPAPDVVVAADPAAGTDELRRQVSAAIWAVWSRRWTAGKPEP
jgi:hypothetical protein